MKSLTVIFCLLIVNFCNAEIQWHAGVVVLKSNQILSGKVSVDQKHSLLLFQDGGQVEVYPAHKVHLIRYFDENANINRKFISVKQKENSLTAHSLFELVLPGDISVIRKAYSQFSNPHDEVNGYRYYLRWKQEIIPISKFRAKYYKRLLKSSESLASFITDNKLSPDFSADIIKMIEFYNSEQAGSAIARQY